MLRLRPSGPLAALLCLPACLGWTAEPQPPAAPVFGAGVDIVAVDVSVLDANGRPVQGLRAEDFQVTLDGQPRPLQSAEFLALGSVADEPEAPRPTHFSTNEGVAQGRLVVLAVDQGALPAGSGRGVMNAAGRLLDRLTPADRVALLAFPGGPTVDFTGDHAKLRDALGRVAGRSRLRLGRVGPEEVLALEGGDTGRWSEVVARECGGARGAQRESCRFDLENEARLVRDELRRQTLESSAALRGLLRALARLDAPKSVVLVGQGLWSETPGVIRELAELAGQARASLHVLLLEEPLADAELSRPPSEGLPVPGILGWRALASLSRGDVYRVSGSGASAFERLAREISGFYLLGFAPEARERDGQPHRLRVTVPRPGLTVRARETLRLPPPGQPLRPPAAALQALLVAPYVSAGLPLRAASFARPAAGRVDVLVRAEIGRAGETLSGVQAGFVVLDGRGQAVARGQRQLPDGPGPIDFTAEVALPPGLYTLRLAAADARERRGSLEHPLKAAPLEAAGLAFSDLMLVPPGGSVEPPEPGVDVDVTGGALGAALEVMGRSPDVLHAAAVRLEIAQSEQGPALLTVPLPLHDSGPGRLLGTGTLTLDELTPGEYWARAVVVLDGKAVGQSARPFRRG